MVKGLGAHLCISADFIRTRTRMTSLIVSAFLLLGLILPALPAAEVMPPKPARYFNDYANVTRPDTQQRLNTALEQFEKDTSSQIVVAVFPKMETDSSIEDYVNRMFRAWQIGQKNTNNGVLLAVFPTERKLRIEVGYGLEGAIPDATAKSIIDREITPRFRAGDIDGGLSAGVNALMAAARGEYKGTGRTVNQGKFRASNLPWPLIIFGGIFLIVLISSSRRRGTQYGRQGRDSGWGSPIFFPGSWGGGGGGGGWSGGDSGGGFSGGGGDSGGGGASGSW
jgi:uncharacterized protein